MRSKKYELSSEQSAAIDIRKNISVSAGAGSGKTRVLTTRYLKLLESGYEIEDIAAITFTEKAALEMKQRIREAIIVEMTLSGDDERQMWIRHLDGLGRASISTIHGFCSNLVKENAALLGVDFNFEIINEMDMEILLREAKEYTGAILKEEQYETLVKKLESVYGEEYLRSAFLNEVLDIRSRILDKGEDIYKLHDSSKKGSLEKFIYDAATRIDRYYSNEKLVNDLLDYSDLERMAFRILNDQRLRERYRKRFKTLMVDEFQDTNEIQKKIIYHIAGDDMGGLTPSKLFVVGDFKQSIYGFRGTNYTIFKEVSGEIGEEGRVSLGTCYRSKNGIIKGVNSIFSKLIEAYEPLMCPDEGKDEEKRIKLITFKKEKDTSGRLLTEVKNQLQGRKSSFAGTNEALRVLKASYGRIAQPQNKSGIAVARAIGLLLDKGLGFKDICILVRSRSAVPEIEEELRRKRVPYCIIGGSGLFKRPEIEELLNLYSVIARGFEGKFDYRGNLNFIKALRGSFFHIPDWMILDIKIQRDEMKLDNLYKAMEYVIDSVRDKELKQNLSWANESLGKLVRLRERLSVVQLLEAIINECGVYDIMLSQENGSQKYRNIEKLLRIAREYDKEKLFAPEQFIEYITLFGENSMDDSEAALDTEDSEAVKIMTIHQSKGLEFKGVIVPRIQANLLTISKSNKSAIVYGSKGIIASMKIDTGEENPDYMEYDSGRLSSEIDEYIRLLYVAITRAKDYAILTGEDDGSIPDDFTSTEGKIKNLDSFLKQMKYVLDVKGGDKTTIEFLDMDELEDLKPVDDVDNLAPVNRENVDKRLKYRCMSNPRVRVSASGYMKYKKCPRRYYIENIIMVKGMNYMDTEFSSEIAVDTEDIGAAELGTLVHSVIEILNSEDSTKVEEAIHRVVEASDLSDSQELRDKIKRYVDNYLVLERARINQGKRIYLSNELEYSMTPYDDGKLSVAGFIDRVEVFRADNGLLAVVTDYKTNKIADETRREELVLSYEPQLQLYGKACRELLTIDGEKVKDTSLQIYFLDDSHRIEIKYDENKVQQQLRQMKDTFARYLSQSTPGEFPKNTTSCQNCDYRDLCK